MVSGCKRNLFVYDHIEPNIKCGHYKNIHVKTSFYLGYHLQQISGTFQLTAHRYKYISMDMKVGYDEAEGKECTCISLDSSGAFLA